MKRSRICLAILGVLVCLLLAANVNAREWYDEVPGGGGGGAGNPGAVTPATVWYVPDTVPTLPMAMQVARAGDVIELAAGVHRIAGSGHVLPAGVLIRAGDGMPGAVILEESASEWGQWRVDPVFILDADGGGFGGSAQVRFENITFRNFTVTFWPNTYMSEPIFQVDSGELVMDTCTFDTFYGTALQFRGGSGAFYACQFLGGRGKPTVFDFAGENLDLAGCVFHGNSERHPGDWLAPPEHADNPGSLLKVVRGDVYCDGNQFTENGPLSYVVDVRRDGTLHACTSCLQPNHAIKQGRVGGTVQLDCCTITPAAWEVLPGGRLLILNEGSPQAVSVEARSLTQVKSLFD